MSTLIIDISPEALERARHQLAPKPKAPRRLPGERHEFREMPARSTARDLTPAQHLGEHGKITSLRANEVTQERGVNQKFQDFIQAELLQRQHLQRQLLGATYISKFLTNCLAASWSP